MRTLLNLGVDMMNSSFMKKKEVSVKDSIISCGAVKNIHYERFFIPHFLTLCRPKMAAPQEASKFRHSLSVFSTS
jgi:hypothetical protein